ncbi:MAG: hypothetical protein HC836_04470 [Richelia sp. RM2_1_2]|nr:hypothetical protein [Richelia sp. SM1_7_0]NJN10484.1 hypothetical protein [Richelia sp. RM1_1_1]NJO26397.1 hypothetical protein [Richelia sp. SL_2_1]NJO57641.1 hypothetical protein [Richelia sp. RM2_1_2]
MKIIRCPKIIIYVFAFALSLQLLTGCSVFLRSSGKYFLSSNSIEATPKISQIHQKFSEDIVPNECPRWFYENYNDIIYNLETVETIKGEILTVDTVGNGVSLQVKTDEETIPVHLAPVWYIENQDIEINPNDTVEIKGSRITFKGETAILAAEVKQGDTTFKLRDENGFSLWGDRKKEEFDWFLDMFPYLCEAE